MKWILIIFLIPFPAQALTDTAVLLKIASSTATQVVRLEKLLSSAKTQLEFTRKLKEATDEMNDTYDTLDDVHSTLVSIKELKNGDVEDFETFNDTIEDAQDKKERLAKLMKMAMEASSTSKAVAEASEESNQEIKKEVRSNNKQISKSFGFGARRNQAQVTAQNTALINDKLTVTNSILKKQTQASSELNQVIIADIVNKEKEKQEQVDFLSLTKKKRH